MAIKSCKIYLFKNITKSKYKELEFELENCGTLKLL